MRTRSLCGALTLLLFASPISALLCGTCLVGDCLPTTGPTLAETSVAEPSVDAAGHRRATEVSAELPPCHRAMAATKPATATPPQPAMAQKAQAATGEKPPCHGPSSAETEGSKSEARDTAPPSTTAVSECCAQAPDTDRESPATPISSSLFEPPAIADVDRLTPPPCVRETGVERAEPPRLSPPPLYQLNSSFLI